VLAVGAAGVVAAGPEARTLAVTGATVQMVSHGLVTAALFLQHFVGGLPWAHLDIASVGDAPKDSFEWTEGPTGFGARLLLEWLGSQDPLEGVER